MLCAIWHHLYNLKNVKNTHAGVLLLVKFTKSNTRPWVFFTFFKLQMVPNRAKHRNCFCFFRIPGKCHEVVQTTHAQVFPGDTFFIKLCLYSKLLKENCSHFPLAESFPCKLSIQPMKLLHLDLHGNFSFGGNCALE